MAEPERTTESYESSIDWWAEQNGKLKQEVEQLRERYGELEAAAGEYIVYGLPRNDANRSQRDRLSAALRNLQEGRDA